MCLYILRSRHQQIIASKSVIIAFQLGTSRSQRGPAEMIWSWIGRGREPRHVSRSSGGGRSGQTDTTVSSHTDSIRLRAGRRGHGRTVDVVAVLRGPRRRRSCTALQQFYTAVS